MRRFRLFWLVFPSYVAITLGLLVLVFLEGAARLQEFHRRSVAASLETEARMFEETAGSLLSNEKLTGPTAPELDALAKRLGKASAAGEEGGVRITVILKSGKVVAESDQDPEQMADHSTRPEIAAAIEDGEVHSIVRASPTMLGEGYMYVAIPVVRGGNTIAVVRTAKSLASVQQPLQVLKQRILWGAMLTLVLVIAVKLVPRPADQPAVGVHAGGRRAVRQGRPRRTACPRPARWRPPRWPRR